MNTYSGTAPTAVTASSSHTPLSSLCSDVSIKPIEGMCPDMDTTPDLDWLDLDDNEELVWSGTPRIQTLYSAVAFAIAAVIAPAIVIGIEAGLLGLLVGAAVVTLGYFNLINTEFVVTTKNAYSKRGIYGRSVTKIGLNNIQDTSFNQGLLGRHFNYGTLFFSTAGGTGNELSFKHIDAPRDVQSQINDQLEKAHTKTRSSTPTQTDSQSTEVLTELTNEMQQIHALVDEINTSLTDGDNK